MSFDDDLERQMHQDLDSRTLPDEDEDDICGIDGEGEDGTPLTCTLPADHDGDHMSEEHA